MKWVKSLTEFLNMETTKKHCEITEIDEMWPDYIQKKRKKSGYAVSLKSNGLLLIEIQKRYSAMWLVVVERKFKKCFSRKSNIFRVLVMLLINGKYIK